ncbi:hypothetical protein ACJMK2_025684 [Sinanodonta woodiana]|uniref:Uncharacterized protein n=1 Tax=Sinanodonta woodiana TaxID=1069815 RepID=A0ABD3XHA6_SINWO
MSILHLVFCSLTIYSVSDGRVVLGNIGQNVSLSWTFRIIQMDAFYILHNGSSIHKFFPNINSSIQLQPPRRGFSTAYYTMPEKVNVTVHILDLTEKDAGTYRVVQQYNLEDLDNRVDLHIIGITHYTPVVQTKMETSEGITHYTPVVQTKMETSEGIDEHTTTALNQKVITGDINDDKITSMTHEVDAEAFPSKSHLMYIVFGMGGILAFVFIACIQHKVRIRLRVDRASNGNRVTISIKEDEAENIQDDNLSGNYWTIVSNPSGELRTAIEMNLERHSEPQLIAQTMVNIDIKSEETLRTSNITRKEDLDGYLNPVHSISTELSDYIHPVHSDPVVEASACIQYIEIL